MSTEAQIKTNRQNAQKSTGPRSPEGKAAVSQNAVKHGLFAAETVVKGKDLADFEAFRDEMLGELVPASPVETMLCERIVSLSWRLKRVERMQNQAIDVMMARDEPSPLTKHVRASLPKFLRDLETDPRGAGPELVLGRAVIKDYSNSRVLDRLSLYERRIEHSLFRTMDELRRLRLMRQMQQAETAGAESAEDSASPQTDEVNSAKQSQFAKRADEGLSFLRRQESTLVGVPGFRPRLHGGKHAPANAGVGMTSQRGPLAEYDLKKQSQFERAEMNVRLVAKKDYEDKSAFSGSKNKPKQSQFNARRRKTGGSTCAMRDTGSKRHEKPIVLA